MNRLNDKNTRKNLNSQFSFGQNIKITPGEAVHLAKGLIIDPHKEHFIAIYLDLNGEVIKSEIVSIGTLTASIIHPRELFRPAIKHRATSIIILHNHPSGDITPSEADVKITKQLKNAGQLLGIEVLDHVIFEKGDRFYSFENQ